MIRSSRTSKFFANGNVGFTLLEVLVATTISIILIVLLLSAAQGVISNYTRTQANLARQGDAAFALDQAVQDIEGLVIPNIMGAEALAFTSETVEGSTNAAWLTLLSTVTDRDTSTNPAFNGATRAVSHRIAYQDPLGGSQKVYAIYRAVISAKETFDQVVSQTNAQSDYWSAVAESPVSGENFLAGNVTGFSVRFLRADTGKWTLPSDKVRIGRDGSFVNDDAVKGGFVRAEVSITVLSPQGAQRVRDGVLSLAEAVNRYGQTAVRQTAYFR